LPFYYRIRLNEYIGGALKEQDLVARKADWYAGKRIELITGTRVIDADPEKQIVSTENKQQFAYDRLLLATGSHSYLPPIQGVDKQGVFTLRTVSDARKIISFAETRERIVLVGGGLLGLETGNALLGKGKKVTVVEFFPRLLPRQLDTKGAARLMQIMKDRGVSFRLGTSVREIAGNRAVESVHLQTGETLPANMVIVSAGVRPNLEPAQRLGLATDKGIVVDSAFRTSRPEIFAAGDAAQFGDHLYGIWPAAMEQGRAAGTNMAGGGVIYKGSTPANKLKVAGIDLASAGEIDAENRFKSRTEETDTVYRKFVVDANHLIGCIMLGDTADFARTIRAINEQTDIAQIKLPDREPASRTGRK